MLKCKVCNGITYPALEVPFNKACNGYDPRASEELVPYVKCSSCGTLFTTYCDNWSSEDYTTKIYNDDYIKFDPDYVQDRATNNANSMASLIKGRCLDYGGGNGIFAKILNSKGLNARTWDPYSGAPKPQTKFKTITSFEVFEHVACPVTLVKELKGLLDVKGTIYFSTLTSGEDWYVAPRNGHITIYTNEALRYLGSLYNLKYTSYNYNFHRYQPC